MNIFAPRHIFQTLVSFRDSQLVHTTGEKKNKLLLCGAGHVSSLLALFFVIDDKALWPVTLCDALQIQSPPLLRTTPSSNTPCPAT